MIGIMADSHGKPETILAALAVLKDLNCRSIYHLGDVCDSTRPETAAACLRALQAHHVITIKGNNDHVIVANYLGRADAPVSPHVLKSLQNMPLVETCQDAILTHSLPFADQLGLSCMIGNMTKKAAQRCFREYPRHVVFRGHSHNPKILRPRGRRIESGSLAVGEKINLAGKLPCVVTCGALTRGWCMLWDPAANHIESLSFK